VRVANGGFERSEAVYTDTNGLFQTSFTALPTEPGGVYSVWAVHPDLNERVAQATFVIQRVIAQPGAVRLRTPYGLASSIPLSVTAGPGATVTNLHVDYRVGDQPGGGLNPHIVVDAGSAVPVLEAGRSANVTVSVVADTDAPRTGALVLALVSDDAGAEPWQKIRIDYEFADARPALSWTPDYLDTGVAPGGSVGETIRIENKGLAAARQLSLALVGSDGGAAPAWARLTSPTNVDELRVGDALPVGLLFQPPAGFGEGDYDLRLAIQALNLARLDLNLHVAVLDTNAGGALFKVVDMYTGTLQTNAADGSIRVVEGVAGARIRLQHERVASAETNGVTDSRGELGLGGLPAGSYTYQVLADNHHSQNGRLWIRPGVVANQQVALPYSLVSVQWEVVPIALEDRYEMVLQTTFETEVPAPVVTIEPAAVNLPQMFAGDVYNAEFVIRNHGLVRADHFRLVLPASGLEFDFEALAGIPEALDARQTLRIPYRVVSKQNMLGPRPPPTTAGGAQASVSGGGGCQRYEFSRSVTANFDYECPNGQKFSGSASSGYHYSYVSGECAGPSGPGTPYLDNGPNDGPREPTYPPRRFLPFGPPCAGGCGGCDEHDSCDTLCCEHSEPLGGGVSANLACRGLNLAAPGLSAEGAAAPAPGGSETGRAGLAGGDPVPGARFTYTFAPSYRTERIAYDGTPKSTRRVFAGKDVRWQLGDFGKQLEFYRDDRKVQPDACIWDAIARLKVSYHRAGCPPGLWVYRGNRIVATADGYRWENRVGDWETYDKDGLIRSLGRGNLLRVRFLYGSQGEPAGVEDGIGRRLLTFTASGAFVAGVEDASGRRVTYDWAGAGDLRKVVDAAGQLTQYDYEGAYHPFVTRITQPGGRVLNATYDKDYWDIESVLDAAGYGKRFHFGYDAESRGNTFYADIRATDGQRTEKWFGTERGLTTERRNGRVVRAIRYDLRTEEITGPNGLVTTRQYDEFERLIREVKPDGGITRWQYEFTGREPVRIVDPSGAMTVLAYDASGNLTNRIEAAGTPIARTNRWVYNELGQLVRVTDPRGHATDFAYDAAGNRIREFDPDNPARQTAYGYDARGNRVAVTNALGYVTLYAYDSLNRVVAETNALGHVTLYTYGNNNLVEVESGRLGTNRGRIVRYRYDAEGRRTATLRVDEEGREHTWETATYDGAGRVLSVANALGQTTRHEYNELGQRVRTAQPFSATESSDLRFEYDEQGRLEREIDPLGTVTRYAYDALDRQRQVVEAVGTPVQRSRERTRDLGGNLTSIAYSDGTNTLTTEYAYDLLSRRTRIRGAREYPKDFEYDAADNLVAEVNGRGFRTEYAYDKYNRLTNTVEGIGNGEPGEHAASFEYDPLGQMIAAYDGNWNHRHYRYDALGRQVAESVPFAFTNALPRADWWNDDALVLKRTWYNPWGQAILTSNIVGAVTATVYDAFGRVQTYTDAAGLTLTNLYTALDKPAAVLFPVVSSAPPGSGSTSVRYGYAEANGDVLESLTDRAGLVTRYGYDKRFRRASEVAPWGAVATYAHDPLDREIALTNALGEVTRRVFDQFNELVATVQADRVPGAQEWVEYGAYDLFGNAIHHWGAATSDLRYAYDPAGNLIAQTDANGHRTCWRYDGRNRRTGKEYADGSSYSYEYDANGNRVTQRDAMNRTTRHEFSSSDLLTRTIYPSDPEVRFGYDDAGRRVSMIDGTGTNTWSYDTAGRVVSNVQMAAGYRTEFTYDAEGNRLSLTARPLNGQPASVTEYSYDAAGRLETLTDRDASTNPARYSWDPAAHRLRSLVYPSGWSTFYDYDALGRRIGQFARDGAGIEQARFSWQYHHAGRLSAETVPEHSDRYAYDSAGRLTAVQRFHADGTADPTFQYTYAFDAMGNRTSAVSPSRQWTYTVNALNQYALVSDGLERRPRYDPNGNLTESGTATFAYDEADRMVSATTEDHRIAFKYDGLGKRVVVDAGAGSEPVVVVYDGVLPLASYSAEGRLVYRLCRGLDLRSSRTGLGGVGGLLAVHDASGVREVISDQAGNIRLWIPQGGENPERIEYEPFGDLTSGDTPGPRFGFSGRERFQAGGILDFGRRFYWPAHGRFLIRDPIEERGGANLYAYANNQPLTFVDPTGLSAECVFARREPSFWEWANVGSGGTTHLGRWRLRVNEGPACAMTPCALRDPYRRLELAESTCSGDWWARPGSNAHELTHVRKWQDNWRAARQAVDRLLADCIHPDNVADCLELARMYSVFYWWDAARANACLDCMENWDRCTECRKDNPPHVMEARRKIAELEPKCRRFRGCR
jgi:RHS repeat-associated protein